MAIRLETTLHYKRRTDAAATGLKPTIQSSRRRQLREFEAVITENTWISIYGANLANTTQL